MLIRYILTQKSSLFLSVKLVRMIIQLRLYMTQIQQLIYLKYKCLDIARIRSTKSVTQYLTRSQYAKVPLKLLTPLT